jgi:geranylgeranyl transferase type-1 subunit beta
VHPPPLRVRSAAPDLSCGVLHSGGGGQAYDGAFGLNPDLEGHGGSTYVAVAALSLLNAVDRIRDPSALLKWCVRCQGTGYRGRPNKPQDCCYSFWIAATLHLIGAAHLIAPLDNRPFNLQCQHAIGGFAKHPDLLPDVLHAHYGLAGLTLIGHDGLKPIHCALGITYDVWNSRTHPLCPLIAVPLLC